MVVSFGDEHTENMRRRSFIGKSIDVSELEKFTYAVNELDQFRFGRLDYNRINEILMGRETSRRQKNRRLQREGMGGYPNGVYWIAFLTFSKISSISPIPGMVQILPALV